MTAIGGVTASTPTPPAASPPQGADFAAQLDAQAAGTQPGLLAFQDPRQGWFRDAKEKYADHVASAEAVESRAGLPKGSTPNPEGVRAANGQAYQFDGAGDALKHVYLSAIMSYSDPATIPQLQIKEMIQEFDGNAHGRNWLENMAASQMDAHNNNVGFDIGLEARMRGLKGEEARDFIVDKVIERMEAGSSTTDNAAAKANPFAPYWLFNHGQGSLDQASPQWREKFRAAVNETWKF